MTTQREPAFVIDPRARAMLAEMGVRVWMPSSAPLQPKSETQTQQVSKPETAAATAEVAIAVPVRREPPLRLPVMDAPPKAAHTALGDAQYVIANLPSDAASYDLVVLGEPCQGAAASLLANMLKVFGESARAAPRIFIAEMTASENDAISLHDQLAAIPAKLVLLLGPHAAKALLDKAAADLPFSKLRGLVHDIVHGAKYVVTYHPQQLLRQPLAKANSWQDLKLARQSLSAL